MTTEWKAMAPKAFEPNGYIEKKLLENPRFIVTRKKVKKSA